MNGPPPPLDPVNLAFVDQLLDDYRRDPRAVGESWRSYFEGNGQAAVPTPAATSRALLTERVHRLVEAYRERGHLAANLDPLGLIDRSRARLSLASFGLSEADLEVQVSSEGVAGPDTTTLRQLVEQLEETYCRNIGVELAHLHEGELRDWLQQRMESSRNRIALSRTEQRRLLEKLTEAEVFEQFLQTKFLGVKRFSLEGAESLIPLIDRLVDRAAQAGVVEIVIGMAHRGRLNVLANIMGKPAAEIFAEFLDPATDDKVAGGDVKYHLGYSNDRAYPSGRVHLSLSFNPSHLEWVGPVVQGRVRAKQDRNGGTRGICLPLIVHGDAAFAGQGIVAEAFNMSELEGYSVGGTVHVVLNNQVGFTTSPGEAYSSTYPTDVARMLQVPIFHVNGEDPESVAQVVELAVDFRQQFHRDALIDLWCYRKYGHNEGDEPSFTQPVMYRKIAQKASIRAEYVERLSQAKGLTLADADALAGKKRDALEKRLAIAASFKSAPAPSKFAGVWARYKGGVSADAPDAPTAVSPQVIAQVAHALSTVPAGFTPHPKVKRLLETRAEMAAGKRPIDWGMGEALAFGTLLAEGARVRLSGQDAKRGTFSHRHGALFDYQTGAQYVPLAHIHAQQGAFDLHNSPLSEASVLGFDYGYSLDTPDGLVIWEAQFGDFVNAAQVVIDQFLVSSEAKWNRVCGLVLLLPHGMEGQGPEHSSARLERVLNLCINDNIQVCNLTTPANLFHILRRQVVRPYRKPLVIMSPKSLLRHPAAVSTLAEFESGEFEHIIPDQGGLDPAEVRRVLLCTGKIYYELAAARAERALKDVAIYRIEKLYPMRSDVLLGMLSNYREGTQVVWVQEEPRNMGAWNYMNMQLPPLLRGYFTWSCVSRPLSASPATGSAARHKIEQTRLVDDALGRASKKK
ncbi:MAG TPA: 2-oxoglutarate dehydrogenase E1 component [Polyangia bacterium]|nr:2-oxoglutarate dehydrogenase E1 component [Polyangia bacterium]